MTEGKGKGWCGHSTRRQRAVLVTAGCVVLLLPVMLLMAHLLGGNCSLKWVSVCYMVIGAIIIAARALFVCWNASAGSKQE